MITNAKPSRLNLFGSRALLATGLFLFLVVSRISAGVLVAPTIVFLDEKNRTGRITIQNPSDEPREISIKMSFGLPVSDSLGNIHVILQDTGITDPRAATSWVRAFPRKMLLPAKGTQVVRFVANPPKDLPDGEYWARVVVRSQEGKMTLPDITQEGQISTQLNLIMQTAIMLKFRKAEMHVRLELGSVEAIRKDTMINVLVDLSSKGNASYVGMLHCRLFDADKKEIGYRRHDLAVYRQLRRRISFPVHPETDLKPYSVELFITTRGRADIAAEDLIIGNEIEYSVSIP